MGTTDPDLLLLPSQLCLCTNRMKSMVALLLLAALAAIHASEVSSEGELNPPPPSVGDMEEEPPFEDEVNTTEALTQARLFEGDILLTEAQERFVQNGTGNPPANERNALNIKNMLWPGNTIPYVIASHYSSSEIQNIRTWLKDFERNTCVKVVPRTNQRDYVRVINAGGCFSNVGKTGGAQRLSLARKGCIHRSTVVHEFMHAAGFWHEQSRADRDRYVQIDLRNVDTKMAYNFNKVGLPNARLIGRYDYRSVMQYGSYAFSNNGRKTMVLRSNPSAYLGQRSYGTMTSTDVAKLKTLYGCGSSSCGNAQGDTNCNYWRSRGYCTRTYVAWMRENCAKACGAC